uniref:Uncharacterized protein n=1 Tax=Chromera velia CCMP2878 TaxID=1169474 RepID=A0A0K6SA06_9ALVE|eukprot:Cvel_8321.t2-p1 / transcript=Cvel_8321.t2 / gene=Cvel_8321 / organism=Chromera_velia_CCMP2878 / gene_product=Cytosolic carboxypeptidase 2, putative / transcript_product=Cytosolic carboxypeptidase 2, putative / location=Cvel_scaffold457:39049-41416(+) / protein_length=426 / sequence_SO=supercontig / SO=protein_coding / is_pseudo=false
MDDALPGFCTGEPSVRYALGGTIVYHDSFLLKSEDGNPISGSSSSVEDALCDSSERTSLSLDAKSSSKPSVQRRNSATRDNTACSRAKQRPPHSVVATAPFDSLSSSLTVTTDKEKKKELSEDATSDSGPGTLLGEETADICLEPAGATHPTRDLLPLEKCGGGEEEEPFEKTPEWNVTDGCVKFPKHPRPGMPCSFHSFKPKTSKQVRDRQDPSVYTLVLKSDGGLSNRPCQWSVSPPGRQSFGQARRQAELWAGKKAGRTLGRQEGRQSFGQARRQAELWAGGKAGRALGRREGRQNFGQARRQAELWAGEKAGRALGRQEGRQSFGQARRQAELWAGEKAGRTLGRREGRQSFGQARRQAEVWAGKKAGRTLGRQKSRAGVRTKSFLAPSQCLVALPFLLSFARIPSGFVLHGNVGLRYFGCP